MPGAVGHSGFGVSGSYSTTLTAAGANGSAGPFSTMNAGRYGGHSLSSVGVIGATGASNQDMQTRPLAELTGSIRPHRRVYSTDKVSSDVHMGFVRNRIIVRTGMSLCASEVQFMQNRYGDWCDENICGLYAIEVLQERQAIMVSFELEGDLMQFNLALR